MPPRIPKPTCSVCFDKFNQTTRASTTCPHCQIQICRTCFQTYLLNEVADVPRCINTECDRGWERNFLDGEMTSTFRLKTYKEHREKVLADREKSKLPITQADAAEVRAAIARKAAAEARLSAAREESRRIGRELSAAYDMISNIDQVITTYGRERLIDPAATPAPNTGDVPKPKPVTAAFVKPCPAPDCKGFLSTAWKCGLCDKYTCPDCHDLKGDLREDPNHHCDPDKVATATLLKAEAKSCPKCGVSICKIEGCDQMWCTQCNTGFSWRTGKMVAGPVHNPHYFDWLRSQGRDPNANPQNGCAADRDIIRALSGPLWRTPIHCYLAEAWRLMLEAEDAARVENQDNDEKLRVMRVKFMLGELNEADWRYTLQRSEKSTRFAVAKAQVAQVFAGGAREIISQILTEGCDKNKIKEQVQDLVKYCNKCYGDIETQFNRKIRSINVEERMREPESETAAQERTRRLEETLAAAREVERVARAAVDAPVRQIYLN
jgi:polyhydroxyalkanoate synthesis regulator phasin